MSLTLALGAISDRAMAADVSGGRAVCAALLAQITLTSPVVAEFTPPETGSTPERRTIMYIDKANANEMASRQHAFLVDRLRAAQARADRDPYYKLLPEERRSLIRTELARARSDAAVAKFTDDPTNDVGRTINSAAALLAASAGGAVAGLVVDVWGGGAITRHAAEKDRANLERMKALPLDRVASLNAHWDLEMRHRPEEYPGMKADMSVPGFHEDPLLDPAYATAQRYDDLKDGLEATRKILSETKDRTKRAEVIALYAARHGMKMTPEIMALIKSEVIDESGKAVGAMVAAANEVKATVAAQADAEKQRIAREDRELRREQRRENLYGGFMALSNLALIVGDSKAAKIFGQAAVVADSIFQIANFTSDQIGNQPFKYANFYLLAISTVLDMFGGSRDAQVLDALRKLALQLEDVRVEMNRNFEKLNLKVDRYHLEVRVDLARIEEAQKSLQESISAIDRDVQRLRADMATRDDQKVRKELIDLSGDCLGLNIDLSPFVIDTKPLANKCLSNSISLGSGSLSHVLGDRTEAGKSGDALRDFPRLATRIEAFAHEAPISIAALDHFNYGSRFLIDVLIRNPRLEGLARAGHWSSGDREYDFKTLIETGEKIDGYYRRMAVDEHGALRAQIFKDLLDEYVVDAAELVGDYQTSMTANLKKLPRSSTDWSNTPPPPFLESQSQLLKEGRIGVCGKTSDTLDGDWPGADKFKVDSKQTLIRKFSAIEGGGLPFSAAILDLMPAAVRHASLVETLPNGIKPFRVEACMSKTDVRYGSHLFGYAARVDLTLDVFVTDATADKPGPKLVARMGGKHVVVALPYDMKQFPSFPNLIWTGQATGDDQHFVYFDRKPIDWKDKVDIQSQPRRFFDRLEELPEIASNLKSLETSMKSLIDEREADAAKAMREKAPEKLRNLDSLRWQIEYLLREGLDLRDARLIELYGKIRTALPTGDRFFDEMRADSPEKALERLRKDIAAVERDLEPLSKATDVPPAVSLTRPLLNRLHAISNGTNQEHLQR